MNKINGFNGEYRFLSNFWHSPIQEDGYHFPTAEHAYQAAKSLDPSDWAIVAALPRPGHAKRYGTRKIQLRPDWEEVKLDIMTEIVRLKFDQNSGLKKKLLATKGMELIEANYWGDTFWGVCNGKGHNHLGKILMDYRDNQLQA